MLLISEQDDGALEVHELSVMTIIIPDPAGSLVNKIPSCAIEQANQEVQHKDCHS